MFVATLLAASVALTQTQPPADDAADRYIVVLEAGVEDPSQVASGIEEQQDVEVGFVYTDVLEGFSAEIPDGDLAAISADPRVDHVAPDGMVHTVEQKLPWGVDMIGADVSSTLAGNGSGAVSNVNAYIIDTGVYKGRTSPNRRYRDLNVVNHVNFAGGENTDCGEGHGTHVAGVVAAKDNTRAVVGVAPGAPLTGVKVLGCNGSGFISTVIEGVDWVTQNARKPAIANVSLSTKAADAPEAAQLLDDAIRRSAESGVFYSVAAGNEGKNACEYSPARAARAMIGGQWVYNNGVATVAAVNADRQETGWSNYGNCIDLWAPGVDILSTRNEGGVSLWTGTSMAAPHVGGTAALYLSHPPTDPETGALLDKPADVESALKAAAVRPENEETRSKDGTRIKFVKASDF
jgi:subtilisin family serine protease